MVLAFGKRSEQKGLSPNTVVRPVARVSGSHLLVPTDVMLPNGATVLVFLDSGQAGARVTAMDGGAALAQVTDAGREVTPAVFAAARGAAKPFGLSLEGTILRSAPEALEDARTAILLLANGARAVADAALAAARKQDRQRFRDRVRAELTRIFADAMVRPHASFSGESQERHNFDWLVSISPDLQLAIDTPVPEHASIAAAVMRNLDVGKRHVRGLRQAIAYSEDDGWTASELAQLRLANVPIIPAPALEASLRDLADERVID
ncbi:hypothetical protein [Roseococcus sp. YIM B11640]|uniref:hypothetical protein n=1 Tax=Roseococcus sp. YIM B11640 TaxID=3133973 RepID=UPI003C7BFC92